MIRDLWQVPAQRPIRIVVINDGPPDIRTESGGAQIRRRDAERLRRRH
jgi:hypothetical protein